MRVSAVISERIGVAMTILGFMMFPLIASLHLSRYWLLPALAAAWCGSYIRSRKSPL